MNQLSAGDRKLHDQLFDPDSWEPVLEKFAKSCRLAVQLFDVSGHPITGLVNIQPIARAFHRNVKDYDLPMRATAEEARHLVLVASQTGQSVVATDASGLGYIAVPLQRAKHSQAVLVAGQVFLRFPDQLALDRIARERGVTDLWSTARKERPISQGALTTYGQLLQTLGQAFLDARYSEQSRMQESQEQVRQRVEELEAVLAAVPAAIWIAHDAACERITGNRQGHELLRLPPEQNLSLTVPDGTRPRHLKVMQNGHELSDDELPLQKAARGERVDGIELEVQFADGDQIALTGGAVPLTDSHGRLRGAVGAFVDITARKALERQQRLLILELQHRTKNLLAVVQSIVTKSLQDGGASSGIPSTIAGRLKALAIAQDFVAEVGDGGVRLSRLLSAELGSFGNRYSMTGPDVFVGAAAGQNLALVLHELTTNAIKYGALSSPEGTISIDTEIDAAGMLVVTWMERGGPPVSPPKAKGFGSQLIEQVLLSDADAKPSIAYKPEGVEARFRIPAIHTQTAASEDAETKGANGQAAASIRDLSVLLVEDEVLIALDAEAQLTYAGAKVLGSARSIDEARRCIASSAFDVAVLDVNLNGQKSYPLADLLADRGITIVFASGYKDLDSLPERWREVPVVSKPYSGQELAAAIAQAHQRTRSGSPN